MLAHGSIEELIELLKIYNDKEYVNDKFLEWLKVYPGMLEIALNNTYNNFFDYAIRNNMRELLKYIFRTNEGYRINELSYRYDKEIFENIDVILDEDKNYLSHFCKLSYLEGFEECVLKNQDKILRKAKEFGNYNDPTDSSYNLFFLLSALPFFEREYANKNKDLIENFIITNFNIIDPQVYDADLVCLFNNLVMSSNKHEFVKEYIDVHPEIIALIFANKRMSTLKREKILDFYTELIKDVKRIENASIVDMILKCGLNSRTLIIKDKVIKSGFKHVKKIPYHKRILQPILRQSIKYKEVLPYVDLDYVEAYERTGDLEYSDDNLKIIPKDLVFLVFKEMLEDGILWADPQISNLGILLKPNLPFHEPTGYKDEEFYIDDETIEVYNQSTDRQILRESDIVVRDVDVIYEFRNIKEFIENKIIAGSKVNLYSLIELRGFGKVMGGPELEKYMNKYIEEVRNELQNNKKI